MHPNIHSNIYSSQDICECAHTYTYTQYRIKLCHKKEWNNGIYSNIDGSWDDHIKGSKSERQILYDITYMWNLKKDTDELTKKIIDIENRLIVTKGGG